MKPAPSLSLPFSFLLLAALACSLPFGPSAPGAPPEGPATASTTPGASPTPLPPLAPKLLDTEPGQGGTLHPERSIALYFDQAMDQSSVEAAFSIAPEVDGEFTWPDDRTLEFSPSQTLERQEEYRVTISDSARSARGIQPEVPLAASFETVGFLEVTQVQPAPAAANVSANDHVSIAFNQPVVSLSIREGQPQPVTFDPPISGEGEWIGTSLYVFRPSQSLPAGTSVTATVDAGLSSPHGAILPSPFSWTFTTSAPRLISSDPASDAARVPLDPELTFTFSQPVSQGSFEASFILTDETGEAMAGSFDWNESGDTATFTPDILLSYSTAYTASYRGTTGPGGTPLTGQESVDFTTVPEPSVLGSDPAQGETKPVFGGVRVFFSGPMDPASLVENLNVQPPIENRSGSWDPGENAFYVNGRFSAGTNYTLTIEAEANDAYGTELGETYALSFRSSDYAPSLEFARFQDVLTFTGGTPTEVQLNALNISRIDVALYRLTLDEFINAVEEGYGFLYEGQVTGEEIRNWSVPVASPLNQRQTLRVPLTEDDPLQTGPYLLQVDSPDDLNPPRSRLVLVRGTELVLKSSAEEIFLWAADLRTGESPPEFSVRLLHESAGLLAGPITGTEGIARLEAPQIQDPYAGVYAITGDPGDEDFGLTAWTWTNGIEPYQFGISSRARPIEREVYLYTDRPLYRRGQTVHFRGVLRRWTAGGYALPEEPAVEIELIDPRGETTESFEAALSPLGTVHGSFELSVEAPLGLYRLGTDRASVHFEVAAYRKPEFTVEVEPEHANRIVGQPQTAKIQADLFFGAPLAGEEVRWRAFGQPSLPPDLPGGGGYLPRGPIFEFGLGGFEELASGKGITGPDGSLQIEIPTALEEPRPLEVTVEATLSEDGDLPVTGRGTFHLHPASQYLSLVPTRYGFRAGEEALVRLHATDLEGEPVPGQRADIEVSRVTWQQVVSDEGELVWESEETLVNRDRVETDQEGSVLVSFRPQQPGSYLVEAAGQDPDGRPIEATARVWILGPAQNIWRQPQPGQLDLIPDQETYQPGDQAQVLIPSPFDEPARILATVERDSVLTHQVLTLAPTGHTLEVTIEENYLPNVFVSVVALRPGGESAPALAAGLVQLSVSAEQKRLSVHLTPEERQVGPGESVTYQIEARDERGRPAEAEFSLSLVDEALLALTEPNSREPFEALYDSRPLTVRTAASLTRSGESEEQLEAAAGRGGGGGGDAAATTVRSLFEDTAYWNPSVETDAEGRARATVRLPDNLTTWRVQARGVTAETEVGQGTDRLAVSKPLLVRPVTPRFFTAGDRTTVAAEVHNNTDQAFQSEVRLQAAGANLETPSTRTVTLPSHGSERVEWDLSIQSSEGVDLTFSALGAGYQDASTPTIGTVEDGRLPVFRYQSPTTAATSGWLPEEGSRTESVSLPPRFDPESGELVVSLEPSLGAVIQRGLESLEGHPYESTEYLASRLVVNAAALQTLQSVGGERPELRSNLQEEAQDAKRLLLDRQNRDGGWGWWPQSVSSTYLTAYALHALQTAEAADLAVREDALVAAGDYLTGTLVSPAALDAEGLAQQAFVLWVLVEGERVGAGPVQSLAEERDRLTPYGQALALATLAKLAPNDASLPALVSGLESAAVLSATGTHWDRAEGTRRFLGSSVSVTAQALHALVLTTPDSPSLEDAVRWLVLSRAEEGDWRTTHETAWALQGLLAWVREQGSWEASYDYGAALNGEVLAEGSFVETGIENGVRITRAIEGLDPEGPNALTLRRGEGEGTLSYTAHLTVYRPAEAVPATSRGLTVERAYFLDDGTCDFSDNPCERVEGAQAGDDLLVRLAVIVPDDSYYVAVEDRFPAGAEPIDPGLQTSSTRESPTPSRLSLSWLGWRFRRVEIDDERVNLFADFLPAGTYTFIYRLHASFAGTYRVLPARTWLVYFPEVYGQSSGQNFLIEP